MTGGGASPAMSSQYGSIGEPSPGRIQARTTPWPAGSLRIQPVVAGSRRMSRCSAGPIRPPVGVSAMERPHSSGEGIGGGAASALT